MKVLITGHTGFKGAWLSLMLNRRGDQVYGLALDPEPGSLFEKADLTSIYSGELRADICDVDSTQNFVTTAKPDAIIHMAAQPLVRESYVNPRKTMETNVMGTLAVLEAAQAAPSVKALLVVTTDKVYRNVNQRDGYAEEDALGGQDPYSASKSMADILTQSWVHSFDGPPTAIARAGNVIGGGDVCADRLVPDLMAAFARGDKAQLRYPGAVRPWQHVLDCLTGYVALLDALLENPTKFSGSWNFGPPTESFRSVADLANLAATTWGTGAGWIDTGGDHPHEAELLTLDASKANQELGWRDALDFEASVAWTVNWFERVNSGASAMEVTQNQIEKFEELTQKIVTVAGK